MKVLSLLLLTFFLVSCGNTEKMDVVETEEVVVDTMTGETNTMTGEVEVMDIQTERVKSEAELEHPERFDPVTWASLPDPR